MKQYQVTLRGVAPLLHGRKDPREETAPRAEPDRTRWYNDQWRYTHYADTDGILGQPGHILKAVLVAGMRETAKHGDAKAGKGKTEKMARACLRIEPAFPKFNGSNVTVPDMPKVLDPTSALALDPDGETQVFVLKRLCDRGVEITNLAINGWELEFYLLDSSVTPIDPRGYFNEEWLQRGLEYGFGVFGMGTWRPEFGRAEVASFELM